MTLLFAAIDLLLIALGLPLMLRRVPPNDYYGLRIDATFANSDVWYAANAASGRDFVLFGIVSMAFALLFSFVPPITPAIYAYTNIALLFFGSIAMAILGSRRANRMARDGQR